MKSFIVVAVVIVCLGYVIVPQYHYTQPMPNAQALTYNYTNIYDNKTYLDLVKQNKGELLPLRDLDFGISISNTCYTMHKNNISSNCPTYEAIMSLFPDTSNQLVSGEFIYKHNQLQRDRPQLEDHYKYYAFQNRTIIFIDPDAQLQSQLSMIRIESSLPEFAINYSIVNNTRYMGEGRYIDECRNAVIDGRNWIFLIGDTMQYIAHDCHSTFTLFSDVKEIKMYKIIHDITTSSKWLHEQFLERVIENCLYEYDVC